MTVSGLATRPPFRTALGAVALAVALIGLGASPTAAQTAGAQTAARGEANLAEDARCIAHVTTRIEKGRRENNAKDVKAMEQTRRELIAMFVLDGDRAGLSEAQANARRSAMVEQRRRQWEAASPAARTATFSDDNAFCFGKAFASRYADAMMDIANLVDN